MHPSHLRLVIESVLYRLEMHSEAAVELLMLTAATESHLGYYIQQHPVGPGAGIYQCETATARDILQRYLQRRPDLELRFEASFQLLSRGDIKWADVDPGGIRLKLMTDLRFATALCRMHYWMVPERLPKAKDIRGLAEYYKLHYNTPAGKATVDKAVSDYQRYVLYQD